MDSIEKVREEIILRFKEWRKETKNREHKRIINNEITEVKKMSTGPLELYAEINFGVKQHIENIDAKKSIY